MTDQIVLLEASKEVTTFLLDDGDVSSKEVITTTGQNIGYEYTNKLYPEDTVTISDKSEIGKEMVKKYVAGSDETPIGIIVNDPVVMTNGQRKASVLVLGHLYRLKLASGVNDIAPADESGNSVPRTSFTRTLNLSQRSLSSSAVMSVSEA